MFLRKRIVFSSSMLYNSIRYIETVFGCTPQKEVLYLLFNSIMTLLRGGSVDPLSVIIQILATLVIVFLALPLHELAHGWVAYKLGDPTASMRVA